MTNILQYDKVIISSKKAAWAVGVAFFVLATALSAYVRIPVPGSPVPITLQTFFVLMAGAVLGKRLGTASQLAYIGLGAAGLPIFQGAASGLSYLSGPTAGYLAGFVIAAYCIGILLSTGTPGMARTIAAFGIGMLIIYGCGAAWLAYTLKLATAKAVYLGILAFVPGDITKILLASVIYARIADRSRQIFPA